MPHYTDAQKVTVNRMHNVDKKVQMAHWKTVTEHRTGQYDTMKLI